MPSFIKKIEILAGKVLPFKQSGKLREVQKTLKSLKKLHATPHLREVSDVENLAHEVKKGDRIRLVKMDNDPRPVPKGTEGTVERVNWYNKDKGQGQIMVKWDNGQSLMLLVPEDKFEKIEADFSEPKPKEAEGSKKDEELISRWLESKGGNFGKPSHPFNTKGDTAYSYDTKIAVIKGDRLFLNETRYSNTTSKIQSALRREGAAKGFKVEEHPEGFFKTSMPHKYGAGEYK